MQPAAIAALIRDRGGVVRGRALRGLNVTRHQLAHAVDVGAITRIRNGVYSSGIAPVIGDAALHGGELACASALRRHGVWMLDPDERCHVWVGANGRAHPHEKCERITHRDAGRSAFGIVSVVHALVQVVDCLGAEAFFAAFESAWRKGLLTQADRVEVRSRLPAARRWLVDIARPDADSGLESLLRLRLHRLGVALDCQVLIAGVGIVDFVVGGRLIIEVDGRENHDGPSARHKDLVRDAVAAALGYETLRFDYALVVHDWERVRSAVLTRLRVLNARRSA
jgi:very-short-patch-repair endonuclease